MGHCFVFVSIAYLTFKYFSEGSEELSEFQLPEFSVLAMASLLFLTANTIAVVAWQSITNRLQNSNVSFIAAYKIWMQSNIGKYLPGNIFHLVGRYALSRQEGLNSGSAFSGIVGEVILLAFAAVLLGLPPLVSGTLSIPLDVLAIPSLPNINLRSNFIYFTIALLSAYLFFKGVRLVIKKNSLNLKNLINRSRAIVRISTLPLLCYIVIFAIAGIAAQLVLTGGGQSSSQIDTTILISAYSLSFIVGFLVPGAPGGIGVRELVLVTLITPLVGFTDAFNLAIALRICSLIADFLGALTSIIIPKHDTQT